METENEKIKNFRSPEHSVVSNGNINEDILDAELDEYFKQSRRVKKNSLELVESEAEDFYSSSNTESKSGQNH